jgi:hypothetical protein
MKNVMWIILALGFVSLSACSEEDIAAAASAPVEKNLFSTWVLDGTSTPFDISNVTFSNTTTINFFLTGGGACNCYLTVSGSQSSGSMTLASCIYLSLGTGGADPGCAGMDGVRTYTKTATKLTVCNTGSGSCASYH